MNPNGTTFAFTPFWLHTLSSEDQAEVRQWLSDAGVNIEMCPGFDFDGQLITTVYYARNEMGAPFLDEELNPVMEHEVREFPVTSAPKAVKEHSNA